MKKIFALVVAILTVLFFVVGCANINQAILDSISEEHFNVLDGETENVVVTVTTGRREKDFIINGQSGKKVNFCVVQVMPTGQFAGKEQYTYSFSVDGNQYTGNLKVSPYAGKYAADIELLLANVNEIEVTVTAGETSEVVVCQTRITSEMISSLQALDLAKVEFRDRLEEMYSKNKLDCEIYIRFVTSGHARTGQYFWYVAFVKSSDESFAVLIDPIESSIIAKKT